MKTTLVILTALLTITSAATAATINVPADQPTIQAAINAATNGDTVIVAPGMYKENINFNGKAVTLSSTDPTNWDIVNSTIINGKHRGSCVVFDHGEGQDSVIEGFMLTKGTNNNGGGILCDLSSPVIRYCNITRNGTDADGEPATGKGGGIALLSGCQATISNCFITNNRAGRGAAIYNYMGNNSNPSTIINCTIADNWGVVDDWGQLEQASQIYYKGINFFLNIINTIVDGNDFGLVGVADPSKIINSCINSVAFGYNDEELYDLAAFDNIITASPRFVRRADPSGLADHGDYHLRLNSPCINAGAPDIETVAKDIDGQPRIIGGLIDIGADEVIPQIFVTRPTAGEVLVAGSTRTIEWNINLDSADILISTDNAVTWQTLVTNVLNTNSYQCHLPDIIDSDQCMIKVVATELDELVNYIPSDLFTIHPSNPDVSIESAWPTVGGSNSRTGLNATAGPEIGCVKWQFPTDSAIHQSVTIGSDDNVHIPTEDGTLYTLSPGGELLWTYDAGSEITSPPTVGLDGTVYIGTRSGKLYAINRNGNLRWTYMAGSMIYAAPTVADNGNLYVGTTDGEIYAMGSDGTSLWTFILPMVEQVSDSILASPAIGIDGSVYIGGSLSSTLYALDPTDGSTNWTADWIAGSGFFTSPIVTDDGAILVFLLDNSKLRAINPVDGSKLFKAEMAGAYLQEVIDDQGYIQKYPNAQCFTEPVIGPDGTFYVSFDDPYLRALNADGSMKWATRFGVVGGFTLTVTAENIIYAACDDGTVYVIGSDGNELSRFAGSGWLSFPVIAPDGTLYVSDSDNTLWAIDSTTSDSTTDLHRPEDISKDGDIDFADLSLLVSDWLSCTEPGYDNGCDFLLSEIRYYAGDIDHNLYVDLKDFVRIADKWLSID